VNYPDNTGHLAIDRFIKKHMEERIHKYFQQELNEEERIRLLQEVESDLEWTSLFRQIKNLYALSVLTSLPDDSVEGKISYDRFTRKHKRGQTFRFVNRITAYAAIILFLVGFTHWWTLQQTAAKDAELISLHVPAGQRFQLTLQDGTHVWLNAQTTISYPSRFTNKERKVFIEGEALFDVEKDKNRPFLVSSQGIEMKVLGTRFNLYSYPETGYIRTSLLEGSLMVYREKQELHNIILKPNEEVIVDNNRMEVGAIKDLSYFLWTEGIYSFNEEPLINILRKLELYYDVEIEVKDPTIYTWEYTGKFRQRDGVDDILRIIRKIHKFNIEKDEENNKYILS